MNEPTFRLVLEREIDKQRKLISDMDIVGCQLMATGAMALLRQERLYLLRRLLEFEPLLKAKTGS